MKLGDKAIIRLSKDREGEYLEKIQQLQKENEELKALKDCVAISCNPPEDCNDPKVLKAYMKACFDLANKENQK